MRETSQNLEIVILEEKGKRIRARIWQRQHAQDRLEGYHEGIITDIKGRRVLVPPPVLARLIAQDEAIVEKCDEYLKDMGYE